MNQPTSDETVTRRWVADTAQPLVPGIWPRCLDAVVGDAVVFGMGESTRASHEILGIGGDILRHLVTRHGFRALALCVDESVVAELDAYVQGGDGDAAASLGDAFVPWRVTETVEILDWLRSHNAEHQEAPVRLIGLEPPAVRVAHYDAVLERLRAAAPAVAERVASSYAILRGSHTVPEHVQRAQGTHPGRPFAELAREAREAIAEVADAEADRLAAGIVEHHENSVAAGGADFDAAFDTAARRVIEWHEATGDRIMFWEGMAHTARARHIGFDKMSDFTRTTGRRLADRFGDGYVSLVVGFDHGRIHDGVRVPPPPADFADAVLGAAEPDAYLLNLRAEAPEPVRRWLAGEHRLRVIAGVYRPEEDARHYLSGGPLDEWFDAVIRVRRISPTNWL